MSYSESKVLVESEDDEPCDPTKDLVGTVRDVAGVSHTLHDRELFDTYPWRSTEGSVLADVQVRGCPVVGAVPGTPAALARKSMTGNRSAH